MEVKPLATDLTARTCDSCANASVCPNKEIFQAFVANRDKLLVKCGDDSGNIDTSETVRIRVEHRYMDGPGIQKLFKDLGLAGSGGQPCTSWGGACPVKWHHPFDSPIFAPHPHAAGYIEPLCRGARDAKGNQLPFIAPLATPRTNEVHAAPYTGLNWWSCKCCAGAPDCKAIKYASIIGGTIFSTFAVTYEDLPLDADWYLADIATPKNIMANYKRIDENPEKVHISSEEDVIVIKYAYYEDVTVVDDSPSLFATFDEIRERGYTHQVEIFYGNMAYIYPSYEAMKAETDLNIESITCGTIGRCDDTGKVESVEGDEMSATYTTSLRSILQTNQHEDLNTNEDKTIGSLLGKTIIATSITGSTATPLKLGGGHYRRMEMVEGDTLELGFYMPAEYTLDLDMMALLSYGVENVRGLFTILINKANETTRYIKLRVKIPNDDLVIQTCYTAVEFANDPVTYPPINYLGNWDNMQIAWNTRKVVVQNDDELATAYQPIAPRKWCTAIQNDWTPLYYSNAPDTDMYIVRPFFNLLGYTEDANKRLTYDPTINVVPASELGTFRELRFLDTKESTEGIIWAVWKCHLSLIAEWMNDRFTKTDYEWSEYHLADGEVTPVVASIMPKYGKDSTERSYTSVLGVKHFAATMQYTANNAKTIYEMLSNMEMPDNFTWMLYALPDTLTSLELQSTFGHEHFDHAPTGIVHSCPDGYGELLNPLDKYVINASTLNSFDIGATQNYLVTIYPANAAGLSPWRQNFVAFELHVTQTPKDVKAQFNLDGSHIGNISNSELLQNCSGYSLATVYPDDAEKVYLEIDPEDETKLVLAGPKAQFYKLAQFFDVSFQQSVTVNCAYSDDRYLDETNQYAVAYKGAIDLDFLAPEGDSITGIDIEVNGQKSTVLSVVDDEIVLDKFVSDDLMAIITATKNSASDDLLKPNGAYTLHLWCIGKDCTVSVTFKHGDNGTTAGCSRCKGYIDPSQYDYIEWVPICSLYRNS